MFNSANSGLPGNRVHYILSDGTGGIWVVAELFEWNESDKMSSSYDTGLSHYRSDGTWDIFTTENSQLPDNRILSLLSTFVLPTGATIPEGQYTFIAALAPKGMDIYEAAQKGAIGSGVQGGRGA